MKNNLSTNMSFVAILVATILSFTSCKSNKDKQDEAIRQVLNKEIADLSTYETVETQYLDSIQDYPCDFACLNQAYRTQKVLMQSGNSMVEFVAKFAAGKDKGDYSIEWDSLTYEQQVLYVKMFEDLRQFAVENKKLEKVILEYKPHAYIRVFEKYKYKDKDGKPCFGFGRYYFDDKYNIKNFIIMTEDENNYAYGTIDHAINQRGFLPYLTIFHQFGVPVTEEILETLANNPNVPIKVLLGIEKGNKPTEQVNNVQIVAQEPQTTSQSNEEIIERVNNSNNTNNSSSARIYVVNQKCGAAISKDAEKRFTKYSVNGDTDGINRMLLNGELVVLQSGDEVVMLDLGFSISKVRTSRGQTVYVDTECLSKR